jgi:lycopene beta-cyclase
MSEAGDDQPGGRTYDVAVVGAGPAGRAIAARAAAAGLDATLIDPAPHRIWHVTYGAWSDELPTWVDRNSIAAQSDSVTVYTPGRRIVDRGYVTFDTAALQRSLDISDVTIVSQPASALGKGTVTLRDGRVVTARTVLDARGLKASAAPAQTAFGVFLDNRLAARYLGDDTAVLMDWRGVRSDRDPSFLYAIPFNDELTLFEETCLAGAPAISIAELRQRLHRRLGDLGIAATEVESAATERVHFALRDSDGAAPPWRGDSLRFGSAGGLMHPATGYSVAASLSAADAVVDAIAHHRDPRAALWPARAKAVYRLRCRGLASLLGLSPVEVVRFFDGFFAMPPEHQRTYLSARDDLTGVATAMTRMVGLTDRALALRIMRGAVLPHG